MVWPTKSTARRVGFPAVRYLLEDFSSDDYTRCIDFHRSFYLSHHVLRVSDCVQQVLYRITDHYFADVEEVKAWLHVFETKGERGMPARHFLVPPSSAAPGT